MNFNNRNYNRGITGYNNRKMRNRGNIMKPTLPRSLKGSFPFPASQIVNLTADFNFVIAMGATFGVHDFAMNDLYAFDVTGGTTNDFSGTTQLANIYQIYHVQRLKCEYNVVNVDSTQPINFGLTFKDAQPSTAITTRAHAINSLEVSPTTGPITVSPVVGQNVFRSQYYSFPIGAILGNPASYNADNNYLASFNASPSQKVWMAGVAYSTSGSTITTGLEVALKVTLQVRVYSIQTLQE